MTGVPVLTRTPIANARLAVEIAWGANLTDVTGASWTWSDVTTDVLIDAGRVVSITVGRQDETTVAQPANCTFALKNMSGNYMPNNPLAANWPNVIRNTPVRVRLSLDNGSTWNIRFQGYAVGFAPGWDQSTRKAIVTVTAAGISRRLAQGKTPLKSALYRTITTESPGPLAYWPLEDGSSSIQGVPATSGTAALVRLQTLPAPNFASVSTVPGSAPIPNFNNGSVMQASVTGTVAGATGWTVEFVVDLTATSSGSTSYPIIYLRTTKEEFILLNTESGSKWQFEYNPIDTLAATLTDISWASTVNPYDGNPHLLQIAARQSGADIQIALVMSDASGNQVVTTLTQTSRTLGTIVVVQAGYQFAITGQLGIGHLSMWSGYRSPAWHYDAMNGHSGETPTARMTRLSNEEGIPFAVVGFYDTTQLMGAQGVDSYTNLMRECETADHGFLYDGLSIGWQYQGISQRYDQSTALTLDVPSKHLYDLVPVDDDQRNVNKVTVQRKNASTAPIVQDITGPLGTNAIGVYDTQVTVNHPDDSQLVNRGGWDVHAGTMPGFRYPTLHLNLMRTSTVAAGWMSRADGFSGPVAPGCHIDVTNASTVLAQHPTGTVEVCLEGYTEQLSATTWDVTANCSNNRQYDVFKIADSRLGRIGTDGSTLASGASAGATSLSVASTGALWTTTATYPADFPMDVEIDGIRVTVTAITGTSSPQTFTVTGATVTKALASGKAVQTWHGGVIKL